MAIVVISKKTLMMVSYLYLLVKIVVVSSPLFSFENILHCRIDYERDNSSMHILELRAYLV
jgi:hypothetical protein